MPSELWRIAVDAPLLETLTYESDLDLQRGHLVNVPLGRRKVKGLVLDKTVDAGGFELKKVDSIDEEYRPLPESYVKWMEWLAQYYIHPPGQVAQSFFPPLRRQEKTRKSNRPPVVPQLAPDAIPELTQEQSDAIHGVLSHQGFNAHLVFGVTGSGKTEIYLRLLEETLRQGKRGLVLVPEISLTPQLIQRFAKRFGDQIAALHSQLTDRERTNQWWQIVNAEKQILIGARSALFCPIDNLGIIIVDEEHEPSFKQEEKLKYHGRDAAIMLGKLMNCPVVLGSATPSLETWKNALDNKYKLHTLRNRVGQRALPDMKVVDLRKSDETPESQIKKQAYHHLPFWLSPELFEEVQACLARSEQSALFLNRRGLAQLVLCPACGHTRECPNCDINLTLHAGSHLICHYCDYHENFRTKCPDCKEGEMEAIGLGTELIESDLRRLFPQANIARADRDEISNRAELEELIEQMESGEIDILVGTQMIAKGLDFPKLKVVGLVLADVGFNLPDFRATERSFQLITQMSGRAGRHIREGEKPGVVIVQTFNSSHDSITYALKHDFEGFATNEIQTREALHYPPCGKLASFRIQGAKQVLVEKAAAMLSHRARQLQSQFKSYEGVGILGPAEAPLSRLRNQFRHHLLIKAPQASVVTNFCKQVLGTEDWIPNGVKISVDVDPMNLL